jgi:hypothetical protein
MLATTREVAVGSEIRREPFIGRREPLRAAVSVAAALCSRVVA